MHPFKAEFIIDESVTTLMSGWPNVVIDEAARRNWGWALEYDFQASADWLMEHFKATS